MPEHAAWRVMHAGVLQLRMKDALNLKRQERQEIEQQQRGGKVLPTHNPATNAAGGTGCQNRYGY